MGGLIIGREGREARGRGQRGEERQRGPRADTGRHRAVPPPWHRIPSLQAPVSTGFASKSPSSCTGKAQGGHGPGSRLRITVLSPSTVAVAPHSRLSLSSVAPSGPHPIHLPSTPCKTTLPSPWPLPAQNLIYISDHGRPACSSGGGVECPLRRWLLLLLQELDRPSGQAIPLSVPLASTSPVPLASTYPVPLATLPTHTSGHSLPRTSRQYLPSTSPVPRRYLSPGKARQGTNKPTLSYVLRTDDNITINPRPRKSGCAQPPHSPRPYSPRAVQYTSSDGWNHNQRKCRNQIRPHNFACAGIYGITTSSSWAPHRPLAPPPFASSAVARSTLAPGFEWPSNLRD